ncbi:hypothetical protein [Thaumasiovibrio subtropicus]|uniref:hypothetical protein n=1 Tax=Thaumasiovibrio subtropicus TaxID=1891207 RepID=UPI000B35515E|nr:hypothetical protein [Thaumasiovibrio subtropicus]
MAILRASIQSCNEIPELAKQLILENPNSGWVFQHNYDVDGRFVVESTTERLALGFNFSTDWPEQPQLYVGTAYLSPTWPPNLDSMYESIMDRPNPVSYPAVCYVLMAPSHFHIILHSVESADLCLIAGGGVCADAHPDMSGHAIWASAQSRSTYNEQAYYLSDTPANQGRTRTTMIRDSDGHWSWYGSSKGSTRSPISVGNLSWCNTYDYRFFQRNHGVLRQSATSVFLPVLISQSGWADVGGFAPRFDITPIRLTSREFLGVASIVVYQGTPWVVFPFRTFMHGQGVDPAIAIVLEPGDKL